MIHALGGYIGIIGSWGLYRGNGKRNGNYCLGFRVQGLEVRWTPYPVIVTIGDNRDYIRVLLYSYYTTITGWGVLLHHGLDSGV